MLPRPLQQIEILQGADTRFDIPILVDRQVPAGGIAGWTFAFRVFSCREDPDASALLTLTSEAGDIWIHDAAAAIARLLITKEAAAPLSPGTYFWRLTSLAPNGDDDVPAHGPLLLNR